MKRRIGILTSGGDCPGLNACIRGVARASYSLFDTEIIGIQDGYAGLISGDYRDPHPGRDDPGDAPHALPQHARHRGRQRGQGQGDEGEL